MPVGGSDNTYYEDQFDFYAAQAQPDDALSNFDPNEELPESIPGEKTFLDKLATTSIGKAAIELNKDIKSAVETGGEDIGAVTRTAATLATGGITTAPLREAGLGIFGGRMSKDAIFSAEKLEQLGYKPSEIKQVTGLERGVEGKWRLEFSDKNAVLKGDRLKDEEVGYLEEVFEHPELYKAYPEARKIVIYADPDLIKTTNAFGTYLSRRKGYPQGAIAVQPGRPYDEMMDTILHEIQHYVQDVEGTGPLHKSQLPSVVSDRVKREALERSPMLKTVLNTVEAYDIKDPEYIYKLLESQGITKQDAKDLLKYADDRIYRTLSSEVEARNVEVRRGLKPKELKESLASTTEDVLRENQIYVDKSGRFVRDKDQIEP